MTDYWRIMSGWVTRQGIETDPASIIENVPAQTGDSAIRMWMPGIDDSDVIKPYAQLARDANGRQWRQGKPSGKLIIGGATPRMFKYFINRFFSDAAHSGQFTIIVFNRGTNDWECYQCWINLPEYSDMEAEGGGYNKFALEWFKGVLQTDNVQAFSAGFSSGFG